MVIAAGFDKDAGAQFTHGLQSLMNAHVLDGHAEVFKKGIRQRLVGRKARKVLQAFFKEGANEIRLNFRNIVWGDGVCAESFAFKSLRA